MAGKKRENQGAGHAQREYNRSAGGRADKRLQTGLSKALNRA